MHDSRFGPLRECDIAIIGMSCRFPGASNVDAFWANLRDDVESIVFLAADELEVDDPAVLGNPEYVRAAAVAPDIDRFDASLFGYAPNEAALIDPQQRMLLECAWEALEDAGYDPEGFDGPIGVFAGTGMNTYLINNVHPACRYSPHRTFLESASDLQLLLGNGPGFASTRISYKLNLRGPSVSIQAACSTGLVAVHMACQSLLAGDCDMVLAGAANVCVPNRKGYLYQPGMIFSPDGHCRAFDAQAGGTVFGSGGGMVVLKFLSAAIEAGDSVYAVIKGSAINNDGAAKVGYSAPSIAGQADVIMQALAAADVDPTTITYVETHGTATRLGDPAELAALTRAFNQADQRTFNARKGSCAIGSVKTNIGHLAEAAGVAGLIKTALALEHELLPASLHFNEPNPAIDFANSTFYVNTRLAEWKAGAAPRRAGVSAFGMGGTNAHVIVEQAPLATPRTNPIDRRRHIFAISARTAEALRQLAQRHAVFLRQRPDACLADLCFTVNTGRRHLARRLAIVAESTMQLRSRLEALAADPGRQVEGILSGEGAKSRAPGVSAPSRSIGFLFSGQGSQYVRMGQGIYDTQPLFRRTLDHCDHILREGGYLKQSLLEVLYRGQGEPGLLDRTSHAQPALVAIEYALAQLWISWGIQPTVVMGHSVGEYVAACLAGVFSLEDGLRLVAARGQLMERTAPGRMAAVSAGESEVRSAIAASNADGESVAIAAVNAADRVVIAGSHKTVQNVCRCLAARGIATRDLPVSRAFHSPSMDAILAEFERLVGGVRLSPPELTLISNVTGRVAADEVARPAYWVRHAREPVRFADGMNTIDGLGVDVLLEVGPDAVLLPLGKRCLPHHKGLWLSTLRRAPQAASQADRDDWIDLLASLGTLHVEGIPVDWSGFDRPYHRGRVHLPTYPFERSRHWIDAPKPRVRDRLREPSESGGPAQGRDTVLLDHIPPPAKIASHLRPKLRRLISGPHMDAYRLGLRRLEDLSIAYVLHAFISMGWEFRLAQRFSTTGMASELGVRNTLWLNRLLTMLADVGLLRAVDPGRRPVPEDAWEVIALPDASACHGEQNGACRADINAELQLLELVRAESRLADALREACDPTQVLFPLGGRSDVARFYEDSPILRAMNVLMGEAVTFILSGLPQTGTIRVLEIGAGTGATTAHVLPHLPGHRTEYVFTDVGASFLSRARARFADHCFVTYRILDIERRVADQGLDAGRYDVVIASNVLHATRDLSSTLRNVRELLAANGMLIMVEGIAPTRWVDLTFGFADGWWRFSDHELRPCSPLVGIEPWQKLLTAAGFHAVASVSTQDGWAGETALSQALLIAQADATAQQASDLARSAREPQNPGNLSEMPEPPAGAGMAERLRHAGGRARRDILSDYMRGQLGRVLGSRAAAAEWTDRGRALVDLGLDSLSAIELRLCFERDLGRSLPSTLTYDHPTADALVDYLAQLPATPDDVGEARSVSDGRAAGVDSWCSTLVPIQPHGALTPFFCVPGILGDCAQFHQMARLLDKDQPFYGLRSLGRDEDVPAYEDIAAIAAHHVEAIRALQPRGPYLLGGHSFGGLVAFEMAQQMLQQGEEVSDLIILDVQAMVGENFVHVLDDGPAERLARLAEIFQRLTGHRMRAAPEDSTSSAAPARIEDLVKQLRRAGQPATVNEMRRIDRVVRANMRAMARYRPQASYRLPIALIRARDRHPDDRFLPDAEATRKDPAWGWSELSGEPVRPLIVPGDHFTMVAEPHARMLARQIGVCLRAGRGRHAEGPLEAGPVPIRRAAERQPR